MYEWDEDVVSAFRTNFRQWGEAVWENPKLQIHFQDAFQVIKTLPTTLYDAVIVDLFDIDESSLAQAMEFLERAMRWTAKRIGLYVATHAPHVKPNNAPIRRLRAVLRSGGYSTHLSSIYIPSFNGYAVFLIGTI